MQLSEFIPHKFIATARRISRVLANRYTEAFDLSVAELSVLSVVGAEGPLSPTAIAEQTAMDKVRVSRATASLVARGLVRQSRDPSDGRGRVLRLTKRGQGIHDDIGPVATDVETILIATFSKSDLAHLRRILGKLDGALDTVEQVSPVEQD